MTGVGSTAGGDGVAVSLPVRVRAAGILFGVLLVATVVVRSFDPGAFNHDVAWVLYVAAEMLEGSGLYVDIIEENPPLVFWLSTPAVAVARTLGWSSILVFNLGVTLGVAFAGALVFRILRTAWPRNSALYAFSVVGVLAAVEVLAPGYEFGQRENLFAIAVFPYVFASAARADGHRLEPRLALAAGLLAGLGIALKPYFLVFWLVIEALLLLSAPGQWKRRENLCIAGVNAVYAALVLLFAPEYLEMIGIAAEVYDAYGNFGSPILLWNPALLYLLAAAGCFAIVRSTDADRQLRRFVLAAAMGFLLVALVQGKGWDYHYDPAEAASVLLIAMIALGIALRADALGGLFRASAATLALGAWLVLDAAAAVALGVGAWPVVGPGAQRRTLVKDLAAVTREHAEGRSVWFMSTSIVPAFPVVNLSGAGWSSRFCCLWLLPGLYTPEERWAQPFSYRERDEMGDLERYLVDAVVEDLERDPPALIFVDRSPDKQAFRRSDFEFLRYFRRDPGFARFFRSYRELGSVGPYRVYQRGFPRGTPGP